MMKTGNLRGNALRAAALMLCTAAIGAAPLMAQDTPAAPPQSQGPPPQPSPEQRAQMQQHQVDMMTKQLNLSEDQVTRLKAIDADNMQQTMALRDDQSTPRDQKRAKMMALRQDRETKIKAMLNPDQASKYDAMQAHARERREEHREGEGAGSPPPPSL